MFFFQFLILKKIYDLKFSLIQLIFSSKNQGLAANRIQNAADTNDDKEMETSHEEGQLDDTDDNKDTKDIRKIHANEELKKEMDLDFEEISDGELEDENRNKGYGDAVGVDWSVLAKETQRPIIKSFDDSYDSIKTRWTPHRILWDIGISVKLAGEEFARKTLLEAREKLKEERLERKMKIEQKVKKEEVDGSENPTIKIEKPDIKEEPDMDEQNEEDNQSTISIEDDLLLNEDEIITHPLANMQVYLRKQKVQRKNLVMNATGKYGRALSARRDLKIRRQLCNLPPKEVFVDRTPIQNVELKKQVEKVFQRLIGA